MIYLNYMTGKCNVLKYKDLNNIENLNGGVEYKLENKINKDKFINLINNYSIIIKTNGQTNFKLMNTIINIYKNRNNI